MFLVAVKCTDIGAYFTGSAIGRHKLIPWLSPGKTWEGLLGGMAAAAGVSVLAVWAMDIHIAGSALPFWRAVVFGVVVGLIGQFGDLSESLMKRSVNVKDSGAVVPEFGGVLDILDSPLLAAPAGYLMLTMC
ncbi:MAG: CDP-archaeol synthase [Planctomycetaceae bacterium]|nr:MAG: CDP-archaeol synthase [Planctomycetaceae bacterium]